ncbi:MAG TPA: GAF domain-containing protein [Candidatus Thermoplasmatota archaeon]|nr:GAF domain-containing protein [Candidatus Thermoplasmatota archaeon]
MEYADAISKIQAILFKKDATNPLQQVVDLLQSSFPNYSWVGLYLVQGDLLVLGPWRGKEATEHTRIPLGKGICGSAAQSGRTEIVDDVSKDTRYLSCFLSTRSEIVVPIKRGARVIGEIDIDADEPAAFSGKDAAFLEKVADMLSKHI